MQSSLEIAWRFERKGNGANSNPRQKLKQIPKAELSCLRRMIKQNNTEEEDS